MTALERYASEWSQSQQEPSFKSDYLEDIMNADHELLEGKRKSAILTQTSKRTDDLSSIRPKYYPDLSSLPFLSEARGRRSIHHRNVKRQDLSSLRAFSHSIDAPSSPKMGSTTRNSSLLMKQQTLIRDASPTSVKEIALMQQQVPLNKISHQLSRGDVCITMKCCPQRQDCKQVRQGSDREDTGKASGSKAPNQASSLQNVLLSTLDRVDLAKSTASLEDDEMIMLPERRVCQCCFEEVKQPDGTTSPTTCNTGHHGFCPTCVKRYIEAWVYGESYPLKTIHFCDGTNDSSFQALPCLSTNCSEGHFTHAMVGQVLKDDKVWEAYQEKIFRIASLKEGPPVSADDWAADDNKEQDIKPRASAVSARGSLISPLEKHTHMIQEAMTEVIVRRCPDCRAPFVKETGFCNKFKCPFCNATLCYVCRQKVPRQGYTHFCVHAYDSCNQSCGKCPLWTTRDEQDDQDRLRTVVADGASRLMKQPRPKTVSGLERTRCKS